jgi:integrase/recombinase XerD
MGKTILFALQAKEHKLPKALSKNEVKRIFNSCNNIKHCCILILIYYAGLRRSELIDLENSDIERQTIENEV